jgi:MtN3 and saliva related transmembrane protein
MDSTELIGLIGGLITTTSVVPQIHKCIINKSAKDLSWVSLLFVYIGIGLNITYGILIAHPAIYWCGSYGLLLNIQLSIVKLYYDVLCKEYEMIEIDINS